ncbi:MAG: DUF1542 domain-containing protein [Candidatus Promineifilaceae bacterium]
MSDLHLAAKRNKLMQMGALANRDLEPAGGPAFERLIAFLGGLDRRRRLAEAAVWLPRGPLAGLLLAAGAAAAARFRPLLTNQELGWLTLALAAGGATLAALGLLLRRRGLLEQARFADLRLGLKERASAAVELRQGRLQTTPELAAAQLENTLRAAAQLDPRRAIPLRPAGRDLVLLLLALGLLLAALILPNPQLSALLEKRALEQAIIEQTQALQSLQEEIQQNPNLSAEQREQLLQPVDEALQALQADDVSREELVAVLSETAAELRQLGQEGASDSLAESLASAGQPLAEQAASQALGQALQSGDLAAASAAANQLADRLSAMGPAEQRDLAAALAQSAEALQAADPELAAQMAAAAEALANGDQAAAEAALRQAAGTLQERAQEQAAAQQAAAAAGQLQASGQAVAQAGRPPTTGQPGGANGQGQAGAGEQGQGQAAGGGAAEEGEGAGLGQGEPSGEGTGETGPGPGGGPAENVYVPAPAELNGDGIEVELPAECLADPSGCGALISETPAEFGEERSLVPYDQVFGDYRDAAFQALERDPIPLDLQGYVRDYFASLEP